MIETLEAQGLQLAKEKQEYLGWCAQLFTSRESCLSRSVMIMWFLVVKALRQGEFWDS